MITPWSKKKLKPIVSFINHYKSNDIDIMSFNLMFD